MGVPAHRPSADGHHPLQNLEPEKQDSTRASARVNTHTHAHTCALKAYIDAKRYVGARERIKQEKVRDKTSSMVRSPFLQK